MSFQFPDSGGVQPTGKAKDKMQSHKSMITYYFSFGLSKQLDARRPNW